MPEVSVIVPVYNSRDYIVTCFESLKNQTLDSLEVLFVDDCGSDDSIAVLREKIVSYSGKKEFRIIGLDGHKGPGAARNTGISEATGEYLCFVDSDDWVESNFCETLLKTAKGKKADIAYCGLHLDNLSNGKSRDSFNPTVSAGEFTIKKHRKFLIRFVSYFTTFIYRREFLGANGIAFPQSSNAEDSTFLTSCILCARRIACCQKPLYHYVRRNGTLTTRIDPERHIKRISAFNDLITYSKEHGLYDQYGKEIDFLYIKKAILVSAVQYIKDNPRPSKESLVSIIRALDENIPHYRSNCHFRRKPAIRLGIWGLRTMPLMVIIVARLFRRKLS